VVHAMRRFRSVGVGRLLILTSLALLLIGLVVASPVGALETRSGDSVVIGSDEVINDDLYVTANEVVVDGTIRGDLIAFGRSVTVDGTVEGDFIGAGQSVDLAGTVDDDVRIAGQTLVVREGAEVEDDLIAAGFSLENEPDSVVGGTLMYAGYQALLEGTVDEDLNVAANGLELGGGVGANVDAEVDGEDSGPPSFLFAPQADVPTVESGLTLTASAIIGGDLTYESSTEAQIAPQAQIEGEVIRSERPAEEEEEAYTSDNIVLDNLRSFLALLLGGLLLVWLAPNWLRRRAGTVLDRPLASLGWGVLSLIAFVVLGIAILLTTILLVVILGLLTLGGLATLIVGLGLLAEVVLVLAFWVSTSYLSQIIVSFLAGVLLVEAIRPGRGSGRVLPLVVGLILYVILRAIPVLGSIVGLIVVLLGLGALFYWIWTKLRRSRATPPPAG
jgi:cytoskeletal protein CcmA (bactofilin family)